MLGLIFVSFGPLNILPKRIPPISEDIQISNMINKMILKWISLRPYIKINKNNFTYKEEVEIVKKTVPSRAIRAAINEIAGYLDCVLYLKDECIAEYEAKEERRKRSTDALDFF